MHRIWNILTLAATFLIAGPAAAQFNCSEVAGQIGINVSPGDAGTCQITTNADGSFSLLLTRTAPSSVEVAFDVVGEGAGSNSDARIASILLYDPEYGPGDPLPRQRRSHLKARGPDSFSGRVAEVGWIYRQTGDWTIDSLRVTGNVGHDIDPGIIYAVIVDQVDTLRVDGNLERGMYIGTSSDFPLRHNLGSLVVGGNVTGLIYITGGVSGGITVTGGLGTDTLGAGITCSLNINRITAGSINADINTGRYGGGYAAFGQIWGIRTTTGGMRGLCDTGALLGYNQTSGRAIDVAGDFGAQMHIASIAAPVNIAGSVLPEAVLRVQNTLANGVSPITIGADNGLHGQIIVLSDWDAPVTVGTSNPATLHPTTISGDATTYPEPSASFGRGAVGRAPYLFHHADCVPPPPDLFFGEAIVLLPPSMVFPPIFVVAHGPVESNGPGPKLEVWYENAALGYYVDLTMLFVITLNPADAPAPARTLKVVPVPGTMPPFGHYHVRPSWTELRCAGLEIPRPLHELCHYDFRFAPDCNGNGIPDPDEIAAVGDSGDCNGNGIIDWCDINKIFPPALGPFSKDNNHDGIPDECASPVCRGDWDGNHVIEPADVSLFISQWFEDTQSGALRTDFDLNLRIQPADVALFVGVWFANLSQDCSPYERRGGTQRRELADDESRRKTRPPCR